MPAPRPPTQRTAAALPRRAPLALGLALLAACSGKARQGSGGEGSNPSILPDHRRIDWTRAGVPGGIPVRTRACATVVAAAHGNGTADASGAINQALDACPAGEVVQLTAGTFRLASPIDFGWKRGVTLRGAGPGKTVLRPDDGLWSAIATGQVGLAAERAVTGGWQKGSTRLTLADASGLEPGLVLDVIQGEDPDLYWSRGGAVDHTGQFVRVVSVQGNAVEIEDPLVWTFSIRPRVRPYHFRGAELCGVEDLTVTAGAGYGGSMIQIWDAYASWVKNVETAWGNGNEHIYLFGCLRCEVRDSYVHDTHSTTDGYGIVTGMGYGGPRGGCTGTLIENNVFSGTWGATILETEVGSVVAYNYARAMRFPGWPDYQIADFNGNHGPHGLMVLWEGNVGSGGVQQDGYHGSVSHATYFRNAFNGVHAEANRTGNVKLLDLCRFSYHHNVVGNVLGSPAWPAAPIGRYEMTGEPDYTAQAAIYRLGYPNMGNNGYDPVNPPTNGDAGGLDPKVRQTLYRWGNYDYQSKATRFEASEVPADVPVPATRELPASLRYAGRPAWWPQDLAWPPIGPDLSPMAGKIPAQLRWEAMAP